MSVAEPDPKFDDRHLLSLAVDRALDIVNRDAAIVEQADFDALVERLNAGDAPVEQLLAHAFLQAMDRLRTAYEPRAIGDLKHRCGWCWSAAGGTGEAWSALPQLGDAEIKAHTLACKHNPMVAAVSAWADARDAVYAKGSTDEDDERLSECITALVRMVRP